MMASWRTIQLQKHGRRTSCAVPCLVVDASEGTAMSISWCPGCAATLWGLEAVALCVTMWAQPTTLCLAMPGRSSLVHYTKVLCHMDLRAQESKTSHAGQPCQDSSSTCI